MDEGWSCEGMALLYSPGMVRRADSWSNCTGHGVRCNCFKSFGIGRVNEGEIFDSIRGKGEDVEAV
jgi:hypothetical protein